MLYVGRSKAKENVMKNIMKIIQAEKLSHTLDWNLIWFFWIRLESMWQSKGQLLSEQGKTHSRTDHLKSDPIMQGIISLLSFGSSDRGWAVICLSSAAMSKAIGEHMLKSLREFNDWKNRSSEAGFTPVRGESTRRMTGAAGEMGIMVNSTLLRTSCASCHHFLSHLL
ncbi:hypothetical protein ACFX11_011637 [Malus domestica]